jgi:hypothetical protein
LVNNETTSRYHASKGGIPKAYPERLLPFETRRPAKLEPKYVETENTLINSKKSAPYFMKIREIYYSD